MANITLDEKMQYVVMHAEAMGITSFFFGFIESSEKGPRLNFRFQKLRTDDAINLFVAGFQHALELEFRNHPEYVKEYRAIFVDLLSDFRALVEGANKKVEAFKKNKI